jgi:hypothetical protein
MKIIAILFIALFTSMAPVTVEPSAKKSDFFILTGQSVNGQAHLSWQFTADYTIGTYTVQRKINCGNLKNCFETIAIVDGSVTTYITPLAKGKNTFRIVAKTVPGGGGYIWESNWLSLN